MTIKNNMVFLTEEEIDSMVRMMRVNDDGDICFEHDFGDVTVQVTANFEPCYDYDLGMEQKCFDQWFGPYTLEVSAFTADEEFDIHNDTYSLIETKMDNREWR